MAPNTLQKDELLTRHEQALRNELERRGFDPAKLLKENPLAFRLTDGLAVEIVLDGGEDPVAKAVGILTAGKGKAAKDAKHWDRVRQAAARSQEPDDRMAAKQKAMGLR